MTLSFSRPSHHPRKTGVYEVQKGDWLVKIVMKELSLSLTESMKLLGEIQALNPGIDNPDVLSVGQLLVLPVRDGADASGSSAGHEPDRLSIPGNEQKRGAGEYIVKSGDTISSILKRQLGISFGDAMNYRAVLAAANPHIKDLNRIYPGQTVILPMARQRVPTGKLASFTLSKEGLYAFLRDLLAVFGGEGIDDGHYYIPLRPGYMTVDCSVVPVVEFSDGTRIMLDRDGRIPPAVAETLEARWNTFHILSGMGGDMLQVALDEVVRTRGAEDGYETRGRLVRIGTGSSEATVFFDVLIPVGRVGLPAPINTLGIRLLRDDGESLPPPLKSFIARQGIEVIELLEGEGPLAATVCGGSSPPARLAGDAVAAAEDFIGMLGYAPRRDVPVSVYSVDRDGFNLTVEAELLLEASGRRIVVTARETLLQFQDILEQQGISIVSLSDAAGKQAMIRSIASLLDLPLREDRPVFHLSGEGEARGERVQCRALRLGGGEGSILFVEDDFDVDLYRLLKERWNVEVVVY